VAVCQSHDLAPHPERDRAKCPKCAGTAFRMLPESHNATQVECLNCGHVAPFVATVTVDRPNTEKPSPAAGEWAPATCFPKPTSGRPLSLW
jgi:Zn ribbon nucleic-acid-binding protein